MILDLASNCDFNSEFNILDVKEESNILPEWEANIALAWRNLRYEANTLFRVKKIILKRLNGFIKYQSLNGILGPSGAGKTTLLNCLNGSLRSGLTNDTEIYINKNEQNDPKICFIQQHVHETIIANMKVKHVLNYAFRFKNQGRHTDRMEQHIENVLKQLFLDKSILENCFGNCSGGEQKRIAIAQELMSLDEMNFLFIDEPTTGLDSNAAYLVMQCLRRIMENSRLTILVSIHMPDESILNLFDKIFVMAKGGVCIFSDEPKLLPAKLKTFNVNLDQDRRPIEEFMKIACYGTENQKIRDITDLNLMEEHEKLKPNLNTTIKYLPKSIEKSNKSFRIMDLFLQMYRMAHIKFVIEFKMIIFQMLYIAFSYKILTMLFEPDMVTASTCYTNDQFYSNTSKCKDILDNEANIQYYQFFQLFIMDFHSLSIASFSAMSIISFLNIFRNEHWNKWYSLGVFYWSLLFVRFIELILITIYVTLIIYFSVDHDFVDRGQINFYRFGHFVFFIWMLSLLTHSMGDVCGVIFLNPQYSILLVELIMVPAQIFSGYMFKLEMMEGINPFILISQKLSGFKAISNGLMYSFYGYDRCKTENVTSFVLDDFGVDVNTVYTDLFQVLMNVFLFNAFTLLMMAFRFSINFSRKDFIQNNSDELIKITYDDNKEAQMEIIDVTKISRIKTDNELKFEDFSRGKIIIGWRALTLFANKSIYEIRSSDDINSKPILRNLYGQFRFGTLNALMGPSGAGKTTLLRVLNGQLKDRLCCESQFYLSKYTPTRVCYITQEVSSHLMPGLTAKQSLIYASRLKNVFETDPVDHELIAKNILNELDIADTENTLVDRCSGGQRKRLALGLELTSLRMPNLICIDEPTSGLDSNSSEVVIACLHKLTKNHNITIIASIHQPNTNVFMTFDEVYVLAKGGVCIYSGPPTGIRSYLSSFSIDLDHNQFPIEELIKYSCLSYTDHIVNKFVEQTKIEILKEDLQMFEETQHVFDGVITNRTRFSFDSLWILTCRYLLYLKGQFFQQIFFSSVYIVVALSLPLIFNPKIAHRSGCVNIEQADVNTECFKTNDHTTEKFELRANLLYCYFFNIFFLFFSLTQTTMMFSKEFLFFSCQHRNGWSSTGAFFLMRTLVSTLQMLPVILIYTYLVDTFESIIPGAYFWLFLQFFLGGLASHGMGCIIAVLTKGESRIYSLVIIGVTFISFNLSNVGSSIERLHYFWQFISIFSTNRFLNEATLLLQYGFKRCGHREIQKTLHGFRIDSHDEYFYTCQRMLIFQVLFFNIVAVLLLLSQMNLFRNRHSRIKKILEHHESISKSGFDKDNIKLI